MNDQPQREETIFNAAIQLPTPEQRPAYLMGACGDDDQLRQRVENLIRAPEALLAAHKVNPADGDSPTLHDPAQSNRHEHPVDETEGALIGRYKLLGKLGRRNAPRSST